MLFLPLEGFFFKLYSIPYGLWSFEQTWVSGLLVSLFFFNDPFFAAQVYILLIIFAEYLCFCVVFQFFKICVYLALFRIFGRFCDIIYHSDVLVHCGAFDILVECPG